MKVLIRVSSIDKQNEAIGFVLDDFFRIISNQLEADYAGIIEHLWIGYELSQSIAIVYGKPPYPFRFAKRVSGRSKFGFPGSPDSFNVGHFNVRPDFKFIAANPADKIILYSMNLVYQELKGLKTKEKKLGGFNSELLCNNFIKECELLGISLTSI